MAAENTYFLDFLFKLFNYTAFFIGKSYLCNKPFFCGCEYSNINCKIWRYDFYSGWHRDMA